MSAINLTDEVVHLKLNEAQDFEIYEETAEDREKEYEFEALHDEFMILINNTATTDDVGITVKAGDYWQSDVEEVAPLVKVIDEGESAVIGPLESAKFLNEDGKIVFEAQMNYDEGSATDDVDDLEVGIIFMPRYGVERD